MSYFAQYQTGSGFDVTFFDYKDLRVYHARFVISLQNSEDIKLLKKTIQILIFRFTLKIESMYARVFKS